MRKPRRNLNRDAKLKKSEAAEHHDVIANEMNAFERTLDSFLRRTIQEKIFQEISNNGQRQLIYKQKMLFYVAVVIWSFDWD